jgi:hypothetical protein
MSGQEVFLEVFPGIGLKTTREAFKDAALDNQVRLLTKEDYIRELRRRYPSFLARKDPGGDILTAHARTFFQYVETCGLERDDVEAEILSMSDKIKAHHRRPWWSE